MGSEQATNELFRITDAFDYSAANEELFLRAMGEMVAFHRERSRIFDGLCRIHGFAWDQVGGVQDALSIPHIIVSAFKERKILSLPEEEIVTTFTSSGTSGQKSQINWDATSRDRQAFMRKSIVESYGLADYEHEVNYICFSYDPDTGGRRGAAHAHSMYATFAPARELFYAIGRGPDGEPEFRLDACVATLERYARTGLPLRVTGFPAFGYVTLERLDSMGVSFEFPPESVLFSGGGWKLHTGKRVSYEEYADLVRRVLGISAGRIRDVYGMVEHGVPYLTCEEGRFHVPIYSRVCAVDPGTMRVQPEGEVGLLKLVTPYIRSVPCISVLSTDLGEVRSRCACGRGGRFIVLRGRGGVKKHDGCAISAAQLLGQ